MDASPIAQEEEYEDDDDQAFGYVESEEEVEAKRQEELKEQRLDSFGLSLARTRSDAIGARQTSGIEDIWQEDREFYEGIDDLNRGDERSIRTDKPLPGGGGVVSRGLNGQSRVFPNITGPFVDSAVAHIADMLLPTEDRPWSFDPTPIPEQQELADQFAAENPEKAKSESQKGFMAKIKGALGGQMNDVEQRDSAMVDQSNKSPEDAFKMREVAKAVSEATEERVWDWHVECQFNAQVRMALEDAGKIGVGVIKGPISREQMVIGWETEETITNELGQPEQKAGGIKLTRESKPYTRRIDPSNLFPARGCGDNIQNGDHLWERDFLTRRQLRLLAKDSTYLPNQIMKCLEEGPSRAIAQMPETASVQSDAEMDGKYEVWYYYGQAEREDLLCTECDLEGLEDPYLDVLVIMVNNRVIKASLPTTDHGGYPYDVFCWRKRTNHWAGIGVGRQIRTAQKMVVGATRSMMNNAGLAGGPMIVFKQGVVRPADGVAGLAPRKVFYIAKDDQTIADATKAIGIIKVDIMVAEMMQIINLGMKFAEENSGFPMLMQGQMGNMPDLVGVVNTLDKNTNAIKRRIGRNFSDDMMCPHLRRYYIYHLMYGPDNEKGDLQVNVKGYASLVERDIQNQQITQMYAIVADPRTGLDPKKWADEYMKAHHLNPADLRVEDEEWAKMLQGWAQIMEASQAADPRLEIAQLNAEAKLRNTDLQGKIDGMLRAKDHEFEAWQVEMDRKMELVKTAVTQEINNAKLAGASADSLEKLKTNLATKIMDINATFKLANVKATSDMMPEPPVEPPGKAPTGESYQK